MKSWVEGNCTVVSPLPINTYTERKKWSRNGSRVELFSCPQDGLHLGTVLVPLCKVVPFSAKKRLIMAPLPKVEPF